MTRGVMSAAEILSNLRQEVTVVLTWKTRAVAGLPSKFLRNDKASTDIFNKISQLMQN